MARAKVQKAAARGWRGRSAPRVKNGVREQLWRVRSQLSERICRRKGSHACSEDASSA